MFSNTPKVALIYDDLVQRGGGEKFFLEITKIYKGADIYCPIISKKWLQEFKNSKILYSKFLSIFLKFGNFGYYTASVLSCFWFESLNLDKYDLVISLCNRFSGVVITKPKTKHICIYTHPAREVFVTKNFSPIYFALRVYLFYALKRADVNVSISNYTKLSVKNYLNLDSNIVPPIVTISNNNNYSNLNLTRADYFLMVGRCTKWKKPFFNNALKVFSKSNKKVIVVGEYFDKKGLTELYKNYKNIVFVGRTTRAKLNFYYKNCIALIHPQIEDFGLTPIEALNYNKPIICYKKGGVLDYLTNDVAVFYTNNFELKKAISNSNAFKFNKSVAKKILENHNAKNFVTKINLIINNI